MKSAVGTLPEVREPRRDPFAAHLASQRRKVPA